MKDTTTRTLEEFALLLAEQIERIINEKYGLSVEATQQAVLKTNGEQQGITLHFEDSNIAPTVYVEEAFRQYMDGNVSIAEVAEQMSITAYEAHMKSPKLPELTPEEARKHITLTLVNAGQNQQMLEKTPHFNVVGGELAAIPRWYISDEASFIVSNDIASKIGLTPDEILQIGQQHINNQHFEARSMREIMSEMMGGDFMDMMPPMEGPQIIVLTSDNKIQGANALLSEEALNQVHEMLQSDYVVLPSSIHEVICVPISDTMHPEDLRSMVREVNMGQVAPEERLSDQIFMHDGHRLTLVGDSFRMEEPRVEIPKMETHRMHMAM